MTFGPIPRSAESISASAEGCRSRVCRLLRTILRPFCVSMTVHPNIRDSANQYQFVTCWALRRGFVSTCAENSKYVW